LEELLNIKGRKPGLGGRRTFDTEKKKRKRVAGVKRLGLDHSGWESHERKDETREKKTDLPLSRKGERKKVYTYFKPGHNKGQSGKQVFPQAKETNPPKKRKTKPRGGETKRLKEGRGKGQSPGLRRDLCREGREVQRFTFLLYREKG